MNPRERMMAGALALILVVFAGGYLAKRWWLDPMMEAQNAILALEAEADDLAAKVSAFNKDRKKLTLARMKSLTGTPEHAGAEYHRYLNNLLREAGFDSKETSISQPVVSAKAKAPAAYANVKQVEHQLLTFTVTTKGTLGQLVAAMEQMQHTPYEHRIKNLTIDRTDASTKKDASSRLSIMMIVETMLVSKAGIDPQFMLCDFVAARAGTAPMGWELLATTVMLQRSTVTPAERNYAEIADKNIFVGAIPIPPPPPPKPKPVEVAKKPEPPKPEPKPDVFMPKYVTITHTDPINQEVYLKYRLLEGPEKRIVAKVKDWDEFEITDMSGNYRFFKARLLKVELRKIYFQVENEVWTLDIRKPFSEAEEYTAGTGWGDWLFMADEGIYDREFERKSTNGDKKKDNKGKQSKYRGPQRQ